MVKRTHSNNSSATVLTKNFLKYGWVGANHAHFEKQFRENDVICHVMTSSKIYPRSNDMSATFFVFFVRPRKENTAN